MKYRKKPVEIEAFIIGIHGIPDWAMDKVTDNTIILRSDAPSDIHRESLKEFKTSAEIKTLEGVMKADYGDYIIKGVKGEIYPCKPDIFEMTYERVE
ncbi:MAG: hypothetical protein EHM25_01010 [Nitrosopumilales archaeon]|nr:MAG: hypothetical protein EHM25_12585 [Nitrosopumilales archaeon]RPJ31527.1 MAG: hypothetical protein EHM25_02520 [Nitrosopumilales archaeon]RPJ32349.1 MAG: hypothetical protein EHM25_01010 [Nitrosopumilales archaeon]